MDELIRVETNTTYNDYKRFSWFNFMRRGRHLKPSVIVMFAALALAVVMAAVLVAAVGFECFMVSTGGLFFFVLLFIPIYFLMIWLMIKLGYKRMSNLLATLHRYEFAPDRLVVESEGKSVKSQSEFKYDLFYRAFELQDVFYLYANKMQALILPKRYMDEPTAERLAAFLKEKMGKKYVKCF